MRKKQMEITLTIRTRLQYFYGQKVENCAVLEFLLQDLALLSDKYPKIHNSVWIGNHITDLYLMSNSTVRVIMLTNDKRLIMGRICGDRVNVDKLECGITDDSVALVEARAVIVI